MSISTIFSSDSSYFWIILFAVVFFEAFSQFCIKKYTDSKSTFTILLISGTLGYAIYAYLLSHIFTFKKLAVANAMIAQLSVVALAIIGYFFLEERLSIKEVIGLLLAFVSAMLLI